VKKKSLLCGILAITLMFSACGKKSESSPERAVAPQAATASPADMKSGSSNMAIRGEESKSKSTADTAIDTNAANSEQKIIKNGSLYIVEENLSKLSDSIRGKAKELGGYIEGENMSEYNLNARVRIPASKFDDFIKYAETGFDVRTKNLGSENITEMYVDNEARLNNLKAQEKQILDILKMAKTVEEVLKVQSELYRIRGEAEALEARKKSWDKQVDYATIVVNADKKVIVADNKKTIISGSDFGKAIAKGFNNTGVSLILFLQNLIIFVFSNIIVLAILGVGGFFGYKKYKKYFKIDKKE
jgi:hypothetical protein